MSDIILSLLSIYVFVGLGWLMKYWFRNDLHERSFTIVSIYALQPLLAFWGLLQRPIDTSFAQASIVYAITVMGVFAVAYLVAGTCATNPKRRSIMIATGLFGNTGTLGVTTGLVLLGPESVAYTTMINITNIFCLVIGAYFYSRGQFSIRESVINALKLPITWAAALAIVVNSLGLGLHERIDSMLEMGAYASIVIQLMIFGMYLHAVRLRRLHPLLIAWTSTVKFLLFPLIGLLVMQWFDLSPLVKGAIFIQLLVPAAVNNINLASLYDCEPETVTELVFMTSLFFIGIVPLASLYILI